MCVFLGFVLIYLLTNILLRVRSFIHLFTRPNPRIYLFTFSHLFNTQTYTDRHKRHAL